MEDAIQISGKTLFEIYHLHGKKAVYSTIDTIIKEFEEGVYFPYYIKDSEGNTIKTVLQKGE